MREMGSTPESTYEDSEVAVLVLGVAVAVFVLANLPRIRGFPRWQLPVGAGSLLLLGWTASVVEGARTVPVLNLIEHAAYLGHTLLMAVWAFVLFRSSARHGSHRGH